VWRQGDEKQTYEICILCVRKHHEHGDLVILRHKCGISIQYSTIFVHPSTIPFSQSIILSSSSFPCPSRPPDLICISSPSSSSLCSFPLPRPMIHVSSLHLPLSTSSTNPSSHTRIPTTPRYPHHERNETHTFKNIKSSAASATQSEMAVQRPMPPFAAKRVQRASSGASMAGCPQLD
jgi:hypothetical protein